MPNSAPSNVPLFQRNDRPDAPTPGDNIDWSDTEDRFLPRPVRMTLQGHVTHVFPAGLQAIPRALLDNRWLKDNGMIEYRRTQGSPPPALPMAPVGSHAYATNYMASGVYDATTIPNPIVTDDVMASADAAVRGATENVRMAQEVLENAVRIQQAAVVSLESARSRYEESQQTIRSRVDENPELGGDRVQLTDSQRRALANDPRGKAAKAQNEKDLGIADLSSEDRAKFDALSDGEKAHYIGSSEEERAVILAGSPK